MLKDGSPGRKNNIKDVVWLKGNSLSMTAIIVATTVNNLRWNMKYFYLWCICNGISDWRLLSCTQCSWSEGVTGTISGYFSLFRHLNICCDPPLEPSRRDGSNEGSQHMFLMRNQKIIRNLSSIPILIWSSVKRLWSVTEHLKMNISSI